MDKDIMKYFVGNVIKVGRGGPESRVGKLLDASDDHLVLFTEDEGVVYYNSQHIKSFTNNMKGEMKFSTEIPKDFEFKKADNFKILMDSLKFQWVRINRGGPEKLEGVLSEVHPDYVSLINKEEVVRIAMFHIKSVSYGLKIEKAQEGKSEKHDEKQYKYRDYDRKRSRHREEEESSDIRHVEPIVLREPAASINHAVVNEESLNDLMTSMEKFFRSLAKSNLDK